MENLTWAAGFCSYASLPTTTLRGTQSEVRRSRRRGSQATISACWSGFVYNITC